MPRSKEDIEMLFRCGIQNFSHKIVFMAEFASRAPDGPLGHMRGRQLPVQQLRLLLWRHGPPGDCTLHWFGNAEDRRSEVHLEIDVFKQVFC